MIINWEGVAESINAGTTALNAANLGTPADTSSVGFYDHAMGDFDNGGEVEQFLNRDRFLIASNKWGSLTQVVSK